MPLQWPALPGGGLNSAECGATSEPAGNAPTRGRSDAAEPGARVTAALVQGRGTRAAPAARAVGSPRVRPAITPSRRCPHPPAT